MGSYFSFFIFKIITGIVISIFINIIYYSITSTNIVIFAHFSLGGMLQRKRWPFNKFFILFDTIFHLCEF